MWYRSSVYVLGMFINFFGVALLINATLGAGFWTSFFMGVSDHLGFTTGFWYGVFQFLIVFVNALLMKQAPEIRAIVPILMESLILDFWLEVVFAPVDLSAYPFLLKFAILPVAVMIIGLGVAIYIMPQFARAPVDQLFLAVSHRYKLSLQLSQTSIAVVMTSLAFIIGGPVGLGTIVPMLLLGPWIQWFYTRVYTMYYRFRPSGDMTLEEELQ